MAHIHVHMGGSGRRRDDDSRRDAEPEPQSATSRPAPRPLAPASAAAAATPSAPAKPAPKPGQGGEHFNSVLKILQSQGFQAAVTEIGQRFGQACAERFGRTAEAQGPKAALAELEEHSKTLNDAIKRHIVSRDVGVPAAQARASGLASAQPARRTVRSPQPTYGRDGTFGRTFRGGTEEEIEGETRDAPRFRK